MKKLLSLLLAAILLLSVSAAFAEEEKITLTMWCIATEADANRGAYEQAIAEFQANHPEIDLQWEAFENQAYKTKIKNAIEDNELPDIFFTWGGAFLGDSIETENVYCLDEVYAAYQDQLPESMLVNTTYDGKHYGIPLLMNAVVLFANMDLLKEAGYDTIPQTYEELLACCEALKEKGIVPFGCCSKETWCVSEYLEPMIVGSVGHETLRDIYAGNASWDDPDIVLAVDRFQDMIGKGYFNEDGMELSNDEVKQNFIDGKYAFYQNGSWNCGDFYGKGNFQVAFFPVLNPDRAAYPEIIGGPNDSLAVSASSDNVELASACAFELARSISHYGYLAGNGLPTWTPDYDTADVCPMTADLVGLVSANAENMVLFGDNSLGGDAMVDYLDHVSMVYGSEIDGAAFASELAENLQ